MEAVATPAPAASQAPQRFEIPASASTTPATPIKAETPAAPVKGQDTEALAPSTPPESEKPETKTQEPAERRNESRRLERRFDKLYRRAAQAEERAALLSKELEGFKARPVDPTEPKLEQFDYDPDKYANAKAEWASKKALKDQQEQSRIGAQKEAREKLVSSWESRVEQAQSRYEDWDQVVGELTPDNPMNVALMHLENGSDIAYHLGKNLKEAERIVSLDPVRQILEIGRLSARVAAEKPKTPSKAPAPITPVAAVSSADSSAPSPNDDMKTFIQKRNAQVHGRRVF